MSVDPRVRHTILGRQKRTTLSASIGQALPEKTTKFHPEMFLSQAGGGRTIASFEKGVVVFNQGDPADSLFYIQRGKVKLTVVSNGGKEAVIAVLSAGDFFGEGCLAAQHYHVATASAMSACSIMRLKKATAADTLRQEPAFAELMLAYVLTRASRIEADLIDQLFNSSEKRLARALLMLANFGQESDPDKSIGKISQETLAEMIGTTRSRVSFFMNRFRRLGYVDYSNNSNGRIKVNSSLLSIVLHD